MQAAWPPLEKNWADTQLSETQQRGVDKTASLPAWALHPPWTLPAPPAQGALTRLSPVAEREPAPGRGGPQAGKETPQASVSSDVELGWASQSGYED